MAKKEIKGMIVVPWANLRKGPGMDKEVLKVLPKGTELKVTEIGEEWTRVRGGYMKTELLDIEEEIKDDLETD